MDQSNYSGSGSVTQEFERGLAQRFSSPFCVTVNSGTAAIYVALRTLFPEGGKKIAIQSLAPAMSYIPILLSGNRPVFIDADDERPFAPNAVALEQTLQEGEANGLLTVGMWGRQSFSDSLLAIVNRTQVTHIEDIAQSQFATYNHRYLGTFGQIGCGSLHNNKILQTGEGGFLLCGTNQSALRANEIREFGGNLFSLGDRYLKLKISGYAASVGTEHLGTIDQELAHRKQIANECFQMLTRAADVTWPTEDSGYCSSNYGLAVLASDSQTKNQLQCELESRGVLCDTVKYRVGPAYEVFPWLSTFQAECPCAGAFARRLVAFRLPSKREATAQEVLLEALSRL